MRNPQMAARNARFAAMEDHGAEAERELEEAAAREADEASRLIQVDLAALAVARAKTLA
jgi:hypothetical protein